MSSASPPCYILVGRTLTGPGSTEETAKQVLMSS